MRSIETHPIYGVAAPRIGWVPAPRYLLRRDRILKMIEHLPRGNLLEVGCGAGALLNDLAERGFSCTAYEKSHEAAEIAALLNWKNRNARVSLEVKHEWTGAFDYLLAFEVLEHIEDDRAALEQWACWLRPRGRLLISVPAHPDRWNATDELGGHYRRYERRGLEELLRRTGFVVERIECYGFPLGNLLEPLRAQYHGRVLLTHSTNEQTASEELAVTDRSGIDRPLESRLWPLQASRLGTGFMRLCFLLQTFFLEKDWGNGYICLARRR